MDLKLKDVADLLSVSETTIEKWVSDGKMPAYCIDQQYRFNRDEIEDWMIKQKDLQTNDEEKNVSPSGNRQFSLYRAVNKGLLLSNVKGNNKESIIRNVTREIASQMHLDQDVLAELLIDRENLHSTALSNGIAVPHARDFLLNSSFDIVTIVFPEQPIPFDALDGKPVHTLFFLFASDDKRHLHLLSKIAHFSHKPGTISYLQSKPKKEDLLAYVKNWETSCS